MSNGLKTTNYFTHDSNARNDEKLVRLRMKHGAAGYGVYFMLLERLREEFDYMSAKDYNMIAFDLRVDAALVKSVVEDFGLFVLTDDGQHFYSESFTRRMRRKDIISEHRSKAGSLGMASRWGDKQQEKAEEATLPVSIDAAKAPAVTQTDVDDEQCLKSFFSKENKSNIETLLMQFGLQPDDTPVLRKLAKEVVAEWKIADLHHHDYTDWARHLINTMRIKQIDKQPKTARGRKPAAKVATTQPIPPKPADYKYSGGFGSKDV